MNSDTKKNKQGQLLAFSCPEEKLANLITEAKESFDDFFASLKVSLVEFLLSSERELLAGPKYQPRPQWEKWGTQKGSVYVGGERVQVKKPRLRKNGHEVPLSTYKELSERSRFSRELLQKALKGISCRDYKGTLDGLLDDFGLSKSSISRHLKDASAQQLKVLNERSLTEIDLFAIFIDGYHIAGKVFVVGLAIDIRGKKHALGFWEGATENNEVCQELFNHWESRGLQLSEKVLYVTDGGKGVIKALKARFGKALMHQRCTVHKDRNIQKHLPKKYRKEAHRRFRNAIDCAQYEDAQGELKQLEGWLEKINPSSAESLRECFEELLTIHRLKAPPLLRKTLHSTNPIESMFSQASHRIGRIRYMQRGNMAQRWMGTALLHAEERFRTIKGYLTIPEVRDNIVSLQEELKATVA